MFSEALDKRKMECDKLQKVYHALDADTVKKKIFHEKLDQLTETVKVLAKENVAQ